jgi:nitroimidazol reductase NimA-like FMN-containing flavoprotein (pyridoxamine 5'-phosphate oxidase superfamily)
MLGELSNSEIETLLDDQLIGRIGCGEAGDVFVVPITYAYDGNYIYGHSKEGMKIRMMRKNPSVCFEVDQITDMTNWKSVILLGTYEEFENEKERQLAMKIFSDRMKPFMTSETLVPMMRQPEPHPPEAVHKSVVFRIKVLRKTGRFERVK